MINKILIALAMLLALYGGHEWDKQRAVANAVTVTSLKLNQEYQKQLNVAAKIARDKQDAMQESADKDRDAKDETIRTISDQRDAALIKLRNRPSRPTTPDTPKDSNVSQACTGRELFREDAEFLTREAARADQIVAERNYYYSQYEKVRKQLYGINGQD